MLRKYEIDSLGQPVVTQVERHVLKLPLPLPYVEIKHIYRYVTDDHPTYWLTFNVRTHEMSQTRTSGREFVMKVLSNVYYNDLIFALVGTAYRLVLKNVPDPSPSSGIFIIDVAGLVHDEDIHCTLTKFVNENLDFIREYLGHKF